jgi:hypothetical protein
MDTIILSVFKNNIKYKNSDILRGEFELQSNKLKPLYSHTHYYNERNCL